MDARIAIVGAGPAGLVTALTLAHFDPNLAQQLVILERAVFPRDKCCAGALGERGWKVLRRLEAVPDIPQVELRGFRLLSGLPPRERRHPRRIGSVIRRLELDAALARIAQERGLRLEQGVRVRGLEERGDLVRLETERGALDVAAVVGAEGVGSVVRRSMGASIPGLHVQAIEVDTEPAPGDPPRDILQFDVSDYGLLGYAWDFPTLVQGRELVCRGLYALRPREGGPEGLAPMAEPALAARLESLLASRGLSAGTGSVKRFSERGFQPGTVFVMGRRLLVGEAAGIDPLSGEGLAHSMEYGWLAGRFLAKTALEPAALARWQRVVTRSRLGWDLRMCHRLVHALYGPSREQVERMALSGDHFIAGGLSRFAGELANPWMMLRVGADVVQTLQRMRRQKGRHSAR